MLTHQMRHKFLHYFKNQGHTIVASSPVVPHEDPTLLFTNAGMNQFKDLFLGKSIASYKRAVTSQKCIRAGGKHNDLENVGHTSRHLTFFEMLGNFSFGDYFKAEAIQFAWETATQVFEFDPNLIWPTVFRDDDEAFELWRKYVPAERITRFGEKDNFWSMGETGPCGPCSELLYDRGPQFGNATKPSEDLSGERFLEFWNLVFMQYNRTPEGVMEPLPKPSIDTGAGLERVVSLKMGVDSLFETDILRSIIAQIEQVSKVKYDFHDPRQAPAFRVIADHLRCLSFAIADGAQPSNVDRGYVLRKILRRAVRYGRLLGLEEPFLAKVLPRLIETMGSDYPELIKAQGRIEEILTAEEEAFIRTLKRGGNILSQVMERAASHGKCISGDDAFKLKDTYGLPIDEILLIAKDSDLSVEMERYQTLETEAKERSRSSQKVTHQVAGTSLFEEFVQKEGTTRFVGFKQNEASGLIKGLLINGQFVNEMHAGDEGIVILDQTPFYAEMGGQVGDKGSLSSATSNFIVEETKAPYKGVIAHRGKLEQGAFKLGERVVGTIDAKRRNKIAKNHTATHLLHWALHHLHGEHIKQAGSVVEEKRLRFDFNHHKALSAEEIRAIEDLVNQKIRTNQAVSCFELPYEEVQKRQEIKQFFGEKYDSVVRVVDIDFSKELCGGTHVSSLGSIGLFRIAKEGSIAAGVRRIEAVTGEEAEAFSRESEDLLLSLSTALKTQPQKLSERIEKLLEENRELSQELKTLKMGKISDLATTLSAKAEIINQIPLVAQEVDLSAEDLRLCIDELALKLPTGVIVLASGAQDRCSLFVRVSDQLVARGIKANEIIKVIGPIIEGSGGGKPNSAQAGGKAPQKIGEALAKVRSLIQ